MQDGVEEGPSNTSHMQEIKPNVDVQTDQNNSSPWKPWVVIEKEAPLDMVTSIKNSTHQG
jgi:hypothetical protein